MMVSITKAEYEAIMFCREQVTGAIEGASDENYVKEASEAIEGIVSFRKKYLKAVAKQTLTVSNLTKVDSFVKIFQKYVETDLSLGNLAWLGREAITIGAENIDFSTLPGDWKSPYIYLDQEETLALVNQYLNPYVEDRTAADLHIPG